MVGNKMDAKKFNYLLIALIVLSTLAIFLAFTWGKSQLEKNSNTVSELIAERDAQQEVIVALQKAETAAKELDEVNNLLNRLLPEEKNQETLVLDIIYTATAESNIPLSSIASFSFSGADDPDTLSGTTPSKEVPGVLEYPFSIELVDISYSALLKLLQEIEENGRIVQVSTVQINPDKTNSGLLSSVSLTMKAYVKP
jgi:Tfp pilus assembly protein PilO